MDRKWLHALLKDRDATLGDLAAAMRIKQSRLSEMFQGKRRLTAGEALRMARFLDTTMEEVVMRAGNAVAA
jgi:plasmid maintenance system antidote protein VapI